MLSAKAATPEMDVDVAIDVGSFPENTFVVRPKAFATSSRGASGALGASGRSSVLMFLISTLGQTSLGEQS